MSNHLSSDPRASRYANQDQANNQSGEPGQPFSRPPVAPQGPRRLGKPGRWLWIVIIIVAALGIGYGGARILSSGASSDTAVMQPTAVPTQAPAPTAKVVPTQAPVAVPTQAPAPTAKVVPTQAPVAVPTQAPAPTAKAVPIQPTKWVTTHVFTGNGPMKTELFTIGDNWKMQWTCDPGSNRLGEYNVMLDVDSADGTSLDAGAFNAICQAGVTSGTTQEYQGGDVYLDISTDGKYTVTIQEPVK